MNNTDVDPQYPPYPQMNEYGWLKSRMGDNVYATPVQIRAPDGTPQPGISEVLEPVITLSDAELRPQYDFTTSGRRATEAPADQALSVPGSSRRRHRVASASKAYRRAPTVV